MEALLTGLIMLLIYALVICVVAYIVTRLVAQFVPGAAAFTWVIWAIAGLIVLILALRLFAPALKF